MDIKKPDRTTLKSYFVKNAVPTASNFADLIDAMTNQRDDGIAKLAGEPLSIQADGADTSQKKAINFYKNFADPKPAWTLSLNPRVDINNAATAKPGWSIGDGDGNSKLFIDQTTGNVGIGTVDPGGYKLNVNGPALFTGNYLFVNSENAGRLRVGAAWGMPGVYSGDDGAKPLSLGVQAGQKVFLGVSNGDAFVEGGTGNSYFKGNVGIGIATPVNKLQVAGNLHMDGNSIFLRSGPADQYDVVKWNPSTDRVDIGGYNGVSIGHTSNAPGNVAPVLVAARDNVGIGIGAANPAERLDVNGRVKSGPLTVGPWPAGGEYAFFGANTLNQAAGASYALLQGTTDGPGRTFLNSPVDIRFRIGNGDQMVLNTNGSLRVLAGTNPINFTSAWSGTPDATTNVSEISNDTTTYKTLMIIGNKSNGGVRRVSVWDRLEVNGTFAATAGGVFTGILVGTAPAAGSGVTLSPWPYESIGVASTNYNLRLCSTNSVFFHTGNNGNPTAGILQDGSFWRPSDQNLKTDIAPIQSALDKILQLRGVTFAWREPAEHGGGAERQIGVIAQEVEKVFPEWVTATAGGTKGVAFSGFEALVVEALRELTAKCDGLRAALAQLATARDQRGNE